MRYSYPDQRIAVVAMGGAFPEADNTGMFWNNILNKKISIKRVPDDIINSEVYYHPEYFGQRDKKEKSYTHISGLIDKNIFLNAYRKFMIPPTVAEQMDENQHAAIYCVDQALQSLGNKCLPKERTAVILANPMCTLKFMHNVLRSENQYLEYLIRNNQMFRSKFSGSETDKFIKEINDKFYRNTTKINEDSAPGQLSNVIAGRIANVFDFWGPAYTVDAACASALEAIICGVEGLISREYDAVITGAADVTLTSMALTVFSGINALSPDGSYPFDKRANGFVIGSGAGVVILKRMEDAIRDNDNILALISGFGRGSDGKGKSIAAPSEEGQRRVIERACKMAGYPIDTIEMVEAHGTGTPVGDAAEINALKIAFQNLGYSRKEYCGVGSVKSNIGHLKSAAGAAAIIKTILSLKNKMLPPTANFNEINPKLQLNNSPFYILQDGKPWRESSEHPRRANVSAFGFGGAGCHILLEEFREEFVKKVYNIPFTEKKDNKTFAGYMPESSGGLTKEVILFAADSLKLMEDSYKKLVDLLEEKTGESFEKIVFKHNVSVPFGKEMRLAIMAGSKEQLQEKWNLFREQYEKGLLDNGSMSLIPGISFGSGEEIKKDQIALLFPGQASQYPNMLNGILKRYPMARSVYDTADAFWQSKYGHTISSIVFGEDTEKIEADIRETEYTHPAVFVSNFIMYKLLKEMGLEAGSMIGHSLGEIAAIAANGMLSFRDALKLVGERAYSFLAIPDEARGKMVSIRASADEVKRLLRETDIEVSIANINSPTQTVVSGSSKSVEILVSYLREEGIMHTVLPVSYAFHSQLMKQAAEQFSKNIADITFKPGNEKIIANHLSDYYPDTIDNNKIRELLEEQVIKPVKFAESIQKMYDDGIRLFIEVGPGAVLSGLAKDILSDKDVKVLTANFKKKNDVDCLNQLIGELFTAGIHLQVLPPVTEYLSNVSGISDTVTSSLQNKLNDTSKETSKSTEKEISSLNEDTLVYSGASIGLPGTFKNVFGDDNFDLIFEGRNLIEKLTDKELQSVAELNIPKYFEDENGTLTKKICSINEVIQLAGKFGKMDVLKDYHIDEKILKQMSSVMRAAVAAGYEALADAGIPLIKELETTPAGIKENYVLPEELRNDTGIIFACGFPMFEPAVNEISRFVAYKYGSKTRKDLISFYESIITKVSDYQVKKQLSDWFVLNYGRLGDCSGSEEVYEFNRNFMTHLTSMANSRLAQFIKASGPNFHIGAACSSTASAITIAEGLIKSGHARRMIIIGAEDPTGEKGLPWVGGGLFSIGAVTNSSNLYEAAVPFDNRRNGMIVSAAAVGLVIEKEEDVKKRGMHGLCRLLGSHSFNVAGHQTKVDSEKFSSELESFISKMEGKYQTSRFDIGSKMVYFSHETYTPKKGGCARTEKVSLERVFGDDFRKIPVCNTKGMTGHTMAGSIDEAVAAKSLQYQRIPPVVNFKQPDPELEGLNLSQGGTHAFEYALRLVTGFGGHGNFILLQRLADGEHRTFDNRSYEKWLEYVTGMPNLEIGKEGRLLVAKGTSVNTSIKSSAETSVVSVSAPPPIKVPTFTHVQQVTNNSKKYTKVYSETINSKASKSKEEITQEILDIFSEITKYSKDMLDLNMEMEADLGIDTVKQATTFSMVWEKYGIKGDDNLRLSNYPTIGNVIDQVYEYLLKQETEKTIKVVNTGSYRVTEALQETINSKTSKSKEEITQEILDIFSEITKYSKDMLDLNMEMEADLGIDTVKQATTFSILWEKYGIKGDESLRLSNYPTIGNVIDQVYELLLKQESEKIIKVENTVSHRPVEAPPEVSYNRELSKEMVLNEVLKMISKISKYPMDMLEYDMEMEADLGIDTVKQATVISMLSDMYGLDRDEWQQVSNLLTIQAVANELWDILRKKIVTVSKDDLSISNIEQDNSSKLEAAAAKSEPEDSYDIKKKVIDIISDITGYPVEMLETEMQINEDLGINVDDQKAIVKAMKQKCQIVLDDKKLLSCFNTIGDLIEFAEKQSLLNNEIKSDVTNRKTAGENTIGLSWQIPIVKEQPLDEKDYSISGKNLWVLGDNKEFVELIIKELQGYVQSAESFVMNAEIAEDEMSAMTKEFQKKPVDTIIDCSGMRLDLLNKKGHAGKDELLQSSKWRFIFYKHLAEVLKDPSLRIICAVSMDGCMGYSLKHPDADFDPFYGAISGFYKGLKKEWSRSVVKVVDFSDHMVKDFDGLITKCIIDEIETSGFDYEIAYLNGVRRTVRIEDFDTSRINSITLPHEPHFLITGGALGITAKITEKLANKYHGRFTLLGRTSLPDNVEEMASLSEQELEEKKQEIRSKLSHIHMRVTPAMIQAEFAKIKKGISIYKMLIQLKEIGCEIHYQSCDIRDEESVGKAIEKAVAYNGPVHVLVHAAGLEVSHAIGQKSTEEFSEVFATKVAGACNLIKYCPKEELRAVIAFSSIAGRFGNQAQVDYCSANNYLNMWIRKIKAAFPDIHAVSIDWSGWKEVGMASRNEYIMQHSMELGINLLEPEEGVEAFMEILEGRMEPFEIIVSRGLGGFADQRLFSRNLKETPFIEWVEYGNGRINRAYKFFSVKRDAIIDQHRLGETPILPGVAMMELCAEFYALQEGKKTGYSLRDVNFSDPFKLFHNNGREIFLEGEETNEGWRVYLRSYFKNRLTGTSELITHSSMIVTDRIVNSSDMDPRKWKWIEDKNFTLVRKPESFEPITKVIGNQVIKVGPLFWYSPEEREMDEKNTMFHSENGMVFPIIFPVAQLTDSRYPLQNLHINPCFMDSILQAAAMECILSTKRMFLPWSIGEFTVIRTPRKEGFYKAYAQIVEVNDEYRTYDVSALDENGELCIFAKRLTFRRINQ